MNEDKKRGALYDMEGAAEKRDVAEEHPEIVEALTDRMSRRLRDSQQRLDERVGADGVPQVEVPEAQRELLKILGYLGDEEPEE